MEESEIGCELTLGVSLSHSAARFQSAELLHCARSVKRQNDETKAQLCQSAGSADCHQGPAEEKVTGHAQPCHNRLSVQSVRLATRGVMTCRSKVHPETPVSQVASKKQTSIKVV